MQAGRGRPGVLFEECRFDVEVIGITGDLGDPLGIFRMERRVGDIRDPLAGADMQGALPQFSELDRAPSGNLDPGLVRCATPDGALGIVEPRADVEPHPLHTLSPYIHAQALLESESQTGDAVIEGRAFDVKVVLLQGQPWRETGVFPPLRDEAVSRTKNG